MTQKKKRERPKDLELQRELREAYLDELDQLKKKTLAEILVLQKKYKERGLVF